MAGTILYKLSLDSTQFQTGLNNAMKSLDKAAKQMQKVGESMTKYISVPMAAAGVASVMAWDESAKALAQVAAGVKSTGGVAGFTTKQLAGMAGKLTDISRLDDGEILGKLTAQLLSFTNIAGEQFEMAQVAALNLAARLDGDLQSSAIMLGKALNDPIKGISAMGEAGIQFTDTQKGAIKALWETGQAAAAQNMILAELEKQYGGSSEATLAGAGNIIQFKNSLVNLSEEFGRIIMNSISPFIDYLRDMAKGFLNMDEATKKTIVVIAGIAAAIGPAIFIFGKLASVIPLAVTAMAALSTGGIAVLLLGLGLAGTAIYGYINKNKELTDSVSKVNSSIVSEKSNLDFLFGSLKNSAEGTQTRKTAISQINEKYGTYLDNLLTEKSSIEDIEKAQKKATTALLASITVKASENEIQAAQLSFLEKRKSIIQDILDDIVGKKGAEVAPVVFSEIEDAIERIKESGSSDEFKNIAGAFARQFRNADTDIGTYTENLQQFAKLLGFEQERDKIISQIESFRDSYIKKFNLGSDVSKVIVEGNKEIEKALTDGITVDQNTIDRIDKEKTQNKGLDTIAPYKKEKKWKILTDSDGGQAWGEDFDAMFETDKLDAWAEHLKLKATEAKEAISSVSLAVIDMGAIIGPAMENLFAGFGNSLGDLITGAGSMKSGFQMIMSVVSDFLSAFGKALIAAGVAKIAFDNLMMSGPAAIAAGVALIALSRIVSNVMNKGLSGGGSSQEAYTGPSLAGVPALATGGLAYAPTLATVGDNANAHIDPEVIAPLSKLRDAMGFGGGAPGRIEMFVRGNELVAMIDSEYLRRALMR